VTTTLARNNAIWPKSRSFITSDGTPIAYEVLGDLSSPRTPVVFMNGWTCPDAYWRRIVPAVLEAGWPVVLFDTRGHGESGLPCELDVFGRVPDECVSVRRIATDVIELLDAAGIDRAVLAGHSMGVQGLFEAYAVAPDRVAGLVPIAGTYENPVPTFAEQPMLDKLFPIGDFVFRRVPFGVLRPLAVHADRMPPSMSLRIIRAILRTSPAVVYEDVAPHIRQISTVHFGVLWRMMSNMRRHSAAAVLPTISAPTLILGGLRDHFTPPSVQRRTHELIPGSELVQFPDGGHLLPVEESAGIADALVDFLGRRVDPAK
jgi:pimeloyl-ACP methyl ester carboxylesterase